MCTEHTDGFLQYQPRTYVTVYPMCVPGPVSTGHYSGSPQDKTVNMLKLSTVDVLCCPHSNMQWYTWSGYIGQRTARDTKDTHIRQQWGSLIKEALTMYIISCLCIPQESQSWLWNVTLTGKHYSSHRNWVPQRTAWFSCLGTGLGYNYRLPTGSGRGGGWNASTLYCMTSPA